MITAIVLHVCAIVLNVVALIFAAAAGAAHHEEDGSVNALLSVSAIAAVIAIILQVIA